MSSYPSPLPVDDASGAIPIIELIHHELHQGHRFTYEDVVTGVSSGGTQLYLFRTTLEIPCTHLSITFDTQPGGTFELFESPTVTNMGVQGAAINLDYRSVKTSKVTVFKNPTVSNLGVLKSWKTRGSSTSGGSVGGSLELAERILKPNTIYLIRLTAISNSTRFGVDLDWYEDH